MQYPRNDFKGTEPLQSIRKDVIFRDHQGWSIGNLRWIRIIENRPHQFATVQLLKNPVLCMRLFILGSNLESASMMNTFEMYSILMWRIRMTKVNEKRAPVWTAVPSMSTIPVSWDANIATPHRVLKKHWSTFRSAIKWRHLFSEELKTPNIQTPGNRPVLTDRVAYSFQYYLMHNPYAVDIPFYLMLKSE